MKKALINYAWLLFNFLFVVLAPTFAWFVLAVAIWENIKQNGIDSFLNQCERGPFWVEG